MRLETVIWFSWFSDFTARYFIYGILIVLIGGAHSDRIAKFNSIHFNDQLFSNPEKKIRFYFITKTNSIIIIPIILNKRLRCNKGRKFLCWNFPIIFIASTLTVTFKWCYLNSYCWYMHIAFNVAKLHIFAAYNSWSGMEYGSIVPIFTL